MNLARKPLVAVMWEDAHGKSTGDFTEEQIEQDFHQAADYTTFGLLIIDDDRGVTIAMEEADTGEFRGLTFIPRGMITRMVRLGIPREPKRGKRERRSRTASRPDSGQVQSGGEREVPSGTGRARRPVVGQAGDAGEPEGGSDRSSDLPVHPGRTVEEPHRADE